MKKIIAFLKQCFAPMDTWKEFWVWLGIAVAFNTIWALLIKHYSWGNVFGSITFSVIIAFLIWRPRKK